MDAIIVTGGTVEEIAALAVGLQGRQKSETTENLAQEVLRHLDHLLDRTESNRTFQ